MSDEQGERPADQPERREEGRGAAEPGSATGESAARAGRAGQTSAADGGEDDGGAAQAAANVDQLDEALRQAGVQGGPEDEEPPFGPGDFVDAEARRGHVPYVGPEEIAAAAAAHRPPRLDPVSAVAASEAHVRRCGFSRCRKPLPDERRAGRKSDTCDPKDTSWVVGEDKSGKDIVKTCGQMALSERDLAAVVRLQTGVESDGPAGVPGLDVVELGERIGTAIPAVQSALGPVAQLLEGLTGVRTQLEQEVAAAYAARDEAVSAKTAADSDAAAARQVAVDAEAAQAEAEQRAEDAERAARRARLDKEAAERAQATAEGQASELRDNLVRADERIEALAERAEKAADDLSRTVGERDAAREAIAEEKQRADAQETRANAAVAAAAELERTLRDEFAAELERRAGEHQQALDAARDEFDSRVQQARDDFDAAVEQVREQAESGLNAERSAHAEAIGQLNQRLGSLAHRAETAEAAQQEQAGLVRELRAALARTLDLVGDDDIDDRTGRVTELRDEFNHLLGDE
ncbi:hypothetical protein [Amycolatopsis sp. NPDC004378]